jgi:hypothetical protein
MPSWVLSCPFCRLNFEYAKIADATIADRLFPVKPQLRNDQMVDCAHCITS